MTVAALDHAGTLDEVAQRLLIQREGGYAGVDVFLFCAYFLSTAPTMSIKEFGEESRDYRDQLGALGGRDRLATPPSISRALQAVEPELVAPFERWLLVEAPGIAKVLQHPSVMARDALGQGWHVFDWDPTVEVLRQRALPVGEDLPPGRRRSSETAAPGYPGRKRGDVQVTRATLQHAGSGLWLYLEMQPGNGDPRGTLTSALEVVLDACEKANAPPERALVRADGAHGHVPFITACLEAGVGYVVRLARYELLHQPDIIRHLNRADWYRVSSSGSGPDRQATDLGLVMLKPAWDTKRANGQRYEPVETRVVVSRYPASTGRGAGVVLEGWHYELYATCTDPVAWPGAEVVASYYGRSSIENRLAQEDRELGLDRIFSYHLPGQQLVTAIGLFLWSWRTCRGMELVDPPTELPDQPFVAPELMPPAPGRAAETSSAGDDVDVHDEAASVETAGPCAAEADPDGSDEARETVPARNETNQTAIAADHAVAGEDIAPPLCSELTGEEAEAKLREALEDLGWSTWLHSHPNWSWDSARCVLRCPEGQSLDPMRVEYRRHKRPRLRFKASSRVCQECSLRQACLGSSAPLRPKRATISIPENQAAAIGDRLAYLRAVRRPNGGKHRRSRRPQAYSESRAQVHPAPRERPPGEAGHAWHPPDVLLHCGVFAVVAACLLPAKLRLAFKAACKGAVAWVSVVRPPPEPEPVPEFAHSDGERQHRRLTWQQRLRWNQLPDGTSVTLKLSGGTGLAGLLPPPRSGTIDQAA